MGFSLRMFVPHICGVRLPAHPVPGESHIQRHVNQEAATKDTRITQKWLVIVQYKADVALQTYITQA